MPQKKKSSTTNNRIRLPFSGVVIAAVMKALEIEVESPDPRTVRRYLSGKPMSEHNETEFFLALGKALVETGTLPIPPIFDEYDVSMPVIAGCAIARAANKWDRLVGILTSQSTRTINTEVALPGILRLVAVDVALRIFALLRMCQKVPPAPEVPTWAQENGGGLVLRRLLTEAGLTRKRLVAMMGVSETSVDNWLDGNNKPNLLSIHMLGDCLAGVLPGQTPGSLTTQIRAQFALAEIGDRLACVIGKNAVMELAENIHRFVWLMTEDVNHMNRPPITEAVGVEFDTFRLGTDQEDAPTLLRNISMDVHEPEWKSYIWAASIDWEINFQMITAAGMDGSGAAGLAQDLLELPNISDEQVQIETAAMGQIRNLNRSQGEMRIWEEVKQWSTSVSQVQVEELQRVT